MRLAKYLAHAGVASRRGAEELIRAGRVSVNGSVVAEVATEVDGLEVVTVDGGVIGGPEAHVVYALHKPLGVVSTARDTHGRTTVVDLLAGAGVRLYPVGRLDVDTSGLILLTNDGELAHSLTHPSFEVPRTYRARVSGSVSDRTLAKLRGGVALKDGITSPASVRRLASDGLELVIHEGRNRQVRRMCEAVGHRVLELERVAFGPLRLGDLRPGAHRRVRALELAALRAAATRSA